MWYAREHVAKLKEGVEAWNKWRKANREVQPNLHAAKLSGANLQGANLGGVDLRVASLSGANLSRANLRGANLSGADLFAADLSGADLGEASLRAVGLGGANLRGTHLGYTDLSEARVRVADFEGAQVGHTMFGSLDLSQTKNLESVRHFGRSIVDIDTIYKSHGKIPLAFLRGCGVPENFIAYMSSLTGQAFEFYSCFISYSTKDQEFADRLYADLQNKGVRCWFAPHDVQAGRKLHEQIDEAIRMHERLLLILSANSMQSEWVKTEIRKARKRERTEKARLLFPVRLVSYGAMRESFDCAGMTSEFGILASHPSAKDALGWGTHRFDRG